MDNPTTLITDYFYPSKGEKLSIDESYRGRMLILSCLIAGIAVTIFWVLRIVAEDLDGIPLITLQTLTAVLFVSPFVFKYTGSINTAGVFVNLPCAIGLAIFTFYDGGFYSSAAAWFPILPVFAVFFSGKRYGLAIATFLLLALGLIFLFHRQNSVPIVDVEYQQMITLYFMSLVTVLVLMLMLAILYIEWQGEIQNNLQAANQAKNDFLSGVSHELRTPLSSMLGYAELLSKGYAGSITQKQSSYLSHIESSGAHLLALISDLLDISKLDSGMLTLQYDDVKVKNFIENVVEQLRPGLDQKNLDMIIQDSTLTEGTSAKIDERHIRQVLLNLLGNAIKFTPDGGSVTLAILTVDAKLQIKVSDSGPGIPEALHEKVFERFYQVHSNSDNKDPGVGLGLAISRDIVELHGGTLTVDNQTDTANQKRSCFVCTIPLVPITAKAMSGESPSTGLNQVI